MSGRLKTRKAVVGFELKADQPGAFRAIIATLNVVDKDGDVSLPGSFPDGKRVLVSAYQHMSWYGEPPVGDGVIGSDEKQAWIDGRFWLDTASGKETYLAVKNAADLQEWSYGYEVMRASYDKADLDQYPGAYRILVEQDVYEAAPVLVGAGVDTGTESIKSAKGTIAKTRAAAKVLKALKASADPATLAAIAQIDLLADELDELVDTLMDDFGIPDPDEVEEGEPEEPKRMPYIAQAKRVLASVEAWVGRSKELASLRAKEGRVLSTANRERLASLADALNGALADIGDLLASTEPEDGKSADTEELRRILLEAEQRQTLMTAGRL